MRAGITEGEDPSEARAKLAASVGEFVSEAEERRWVEQALAYLLGLADAPGGDREELFSAWRTFFERIAERGPTVLVFEDLQWADPGLIDFIESIVEWSRTRAIFVLTLSRPELLQRRPTWGAGQRSFTALHLEPLAPEAMAALLRGFVAGLPESGRGAGAAARRGSAPVCRGNDPDAGRPRATGGTRRGADRDGSARGARDSRHTPCAHRISARRSVCR